MDNSKKTFSLSEIRVQNREKIDITGVEEIFSCDDRAVIIAVCGVKTVIEGENLHLSELSVEDGRISVTGKINGYFHQEEIKRKKGFVSRLLKG